MMSDPGPRPELTWLPVDRLFTDPTYQRPIDRRGELLVKRIADGFSWARFQAVLATPRDDDSWFVIDGQHRVLAAKARGLVLVPSVVVRLPDRMSQAEAFIGANRDRTPMSAQALFYARLTAGDKEAQTLKRLCDAAGVELLRYNQAMRQVPAGKTPAVSHLLHLLRSHGERDLGVAVRVVAECFGQTPGALRSITFAAAVRLIAGGVPPHALKASLSRLGPEGIDRLAAGITTNSAVPLVVMALNGRAPETPVPPALKSPAPAAVMPASPAPPLKVGALPSVPGAGFQDDPQAKRDRGSREPLAREAVFGRSASGSSLA